MYIEDRVNNSSLNRMHGAVYEQSLLCVQLRKITAFMFQFLMSNSPLQDSDVPSLSPIVSKSL